MECKRMNILKRIFILISSITLLSCASLGSRTEWFLSNELPHHFDEEVLTVYVQKYSATESTTGHMHGTTSYDFAYHKVAKVEINLSNDEISKTTVIENNDEQSMSKYKYSDGSFPPHALFNYYCEDIHEKSGRSSLNCNVFGSQKYNDKVFYSVRPYSIESLGSIDSVFTLNKINDNDRDFIEICTFSGQDIQQQLALNHSDDVFHDPNAAFNWHKLRFHLLPDGNSYQTVFQAKLNGINHYYMLVIEGCFNIVELVELDPETNFISEMELKLEDILVLEKGLYESYLSFKTKPRGDRSKNPTLLLIDTQTKKLTEIKLPSIQYVYDKSGRKIIFYDVEHEYLQDGAKGPPILFLDIYSIDSGMWESKEYDVSFPYDDNAVFLTKN